MCARISSMPSNIPEALNTEAAEQLLDVVPTT